MMRYLLLLLLFPLGAKSQITLDNNYINGGYSYRMGIVNLTTSGFKYAEYDTSLLTLYNMNHSVFRQISIPPLLFSNSFSVRYISEELFDTNPATIEYIVTSSINSSQDPIIRIFDETGNLLFGRDSVSLIHESSYEIISRGIIQTSSGVKMTLSRWYSPITEVYSLPGILPCNVCSSGVLTGFIPYTGNTNAPIAEPLPFPNPTLGDITIPYSLPPGERTGELVITNLLGVEVRRLQVTNSFSTIEFTTNELPVGAYLYHLRVRGVTYPGNRFVVGK